MDNESPRFEADYPLWTLYNALLHQRTGDPLGGVPKINIPDYDPLLGIFTDADLAARFIETVKWDGTVPMPLREPAGLLMLAEKFQRSGVKHVGIDISFQPPGVMLIPIDEFIADIKRGGGGQV